MPFLSLEVVSLCKNMHIQFATHTMDELLRSAEITPISGITKVRVAKEDPLNIFFASLASIEFSSPRESLVKLVRSDNV